MIARASRDGFAARLESYRRRIDTKLAEILRGSKQVPPRLSEAMQYSVLGPGKRVRPLLVYASGELCGVPQSALDTIAASVELVHAYSLVHDDLPAMDDDDLRRGRPTTHRAFDEATAILAGDALQALAFEILCTDEHLAEATGAPDQDPSAGSRERSALREWSAARCSTSKRKAEQIDEAALEEIHRRKTGQLIRAAIMMPSELADLSRRSATLSTEFARDIGSCSRSATICSRWSKTPPRSARTRAATRATTSPLIRRRSASDGARRRAADLQRRAIDALQSLGTGTEGLLWLSEFILNRSH